MRKPAHLQHHSLHTFYQGLRDSSLGFGSVCSSAMGFTHSIIMLLRNVTDYQCFSKAQTLFYFNK